MNEGMSVGGKPLILADSTLPTRPDARWLQPQWWMAEGAVRAELGGRGVALKLSTPVGLAVLRRYQRGGWMSPLLHDRYVRLSADRSRGFREFRLLCRLRELNLPVPQALAASFEPAGAFYRAGLLTAFIPDTRPLAAVADALSRADWQRLAGMLKRFFRAGLVHPDLNAHNLLLDRSGQWHMLDFDRARLASRPAAARPMIDRLERSLRKHADEAWQAGFYSQLRVLD